MGMHMQREFQEVIKCSESLDMMEKQETVAFNNLHHISSGQYNRRKTYVTSGSLLLISREMLDLVTLISFVTCYGL